MDSAELLVIDDEQEMLVSYEKILARAGHRVHAFQTAETALQQLNQTHSLSLIICDLKMPGMDGMSFLSTVRERHPHLPVIMVTGYGTLETAIEAVKMGAFDFIEKPFSSKKLLQSVDQALSQIIPAREKNATPSGFESIIGQHPEIQKIFEMITRISYGNANVLITGESGVGKELVARSIHKHSLRRNRPLIPINCSALPESLFESELFGYMKGAFTGAFQSKPGLIELANGGTLFLDEVCEMPHALQVKLLRVLEERTIRRISGKQEIPVDIRVVTATNRDADTLVENGSLREDFFYRINTIHLRVPPLRHRTDDIPLLARHFLNGFNLKYGRSIEAFEASAMEVMQRYPWPGNVRELQNVIEHTYYLADPPTIRRTDLPTYLTANLDNQKKDTWKDLPYQEAKDRILEAFEQDYLTYYLEKYNWNISRTANACNMNRRTLHRLINRYGLQKDPAPVKTLQSDR